MHRYIPNNDQYQKEMLSEIGYEDMEELFKDIPQGVRLERELQLPKAMSELELYSHMKGLADKNKDVEEYACFLGAGAYDHFVPSIVGHIVARQEFYTSYTPYQPEISQGILQAIFEYQTMVCELTGMDVSNASMYDGATALAEASIMACQVMKRNEIIISKAVHPESREVLRTYTRFRGIKVIEVEYKNGLIDLGDLESKISANTAAIVLQSPNFFGIIENLEEVSKTAHKNKSFLVVSVDPISLAILKSPGELGADIVIGEGQPLGNQLSFGGPYLGFFAVTKELMRKMPGRVVGQTTDKLGKRGFVLTLQAREQHIRREKATSNICSNQTLNALAATVYLTIMGKQGLEKVANLCLQKSHYAYEELIKTDKFESVFPEPFFKEFVVKSKKPISEINEVLFKAKIIGGYDLKENYPELSNGWLIAVTEKRSRAEIDALVRKVGKV